MLGLFMLIPCIFLAIPSITVLLGSRNGAYAITRKVSDLRKGIKLKFVKTSCLFLMIVYVLIALLNGVASCACNFVSAGNENSSDPFIWIAIICVIGDFILASVAANIYKHREDVVQDSKRATKAALSVAPQAAAVAATAAVVATAPVSAPVAATVLGTSALAAGAKTAKAVNKGMDIDGNVVNPEAISRELDVANEEAMQIIEFCKGVGIATSGISIGQMCDDILDNAAPAALEELDPKMSNIDKVKQLFSIGQKATNMIKEAKTSGQEVRNAVHLSKKPTEKVPVEYDDGE